VTKKASLLIVCLLVTGIVFVLFQPYFTKGRVPLAIDIPVGMYYPWLNYDYGYPVRPPVKNPLLTDTVSQFWIWRNWAVSGLKKGEVKIWNPYSLAGSPMSPWFHTTMLSPVNIFYWLTKEVDAMAWIVISQVVIGLVGSYLLGKRLLKSGWGAIGFGLMFVLSSYFTGWLSWGTVSLALAFLPWTIWCLDKLIKEGRGQLGLIICLTGGILSGHPQTSFYVYLITLLYFLTTVNWREKKGRGRLLVRFGLINLLALGLTASALVPSIKILAESIRGRETILNNVNFGFIPWAKILMLLVSANFFGNPGTNNYWGGDYNFQEKLVSFGVVPLVLAIYYLVGSLGRKKTRLDKFLWISFAAGLLLSTQYPLGWLIYKFQIPLVSSGPAGRAMIISIFSGGLMASMAIKELLEEKLVKKRLAWAMGAVGLMVIIMLGGVELSKWIGQKQAADTQPYLAAYYRDLNIGLRNSIFAGGIVTIGAAGLLLGLAEKKFWRKLGAVMVILAIFGENYQFFKKYTPFVEKKLYFPQTETSKFLKGKLENRTDWFRIERESGELLPANMWQQYGLASSSGYDPAYLASYSNYLVKAGLADNYSRYIENGNEKLNKFNELGIKYLLVLKRDDLGITSREGKLPWWVDLGKWQEVFSEGPVAILENKKYQPLFKLLPEDTGVVKLSERQDDEWRFETINQKEGKLVIFENMTSDWEVRIDGQLAKIEPHLETFLGVTVPPGKHEVEFKYQNKLWRVGWKISLACGLICIGFLPKSIFRRRNNNLRLTKCPS
jgi:hypothetical protein